MLFCLKAGAPEYNNDIECCWPYMIDQHPFPPVLIKNGRVLPIFSTLLSFHPFLAILCSLPVGYSIEQTDHESNQHKFLVHVTLRLTVFFILNQLGEAHKV